MLYQNFFYLLKLYNAVTLKKKKTAAYKNKKNWQPLQKMASQLSHYFYIKQRSYRYHFSCY